MTALDKLSFLSARQRRMVSVSLVLLGISLCIVVATFLFTIFIGYTRSRSDAMWRNPASAEELRLTEKKTEEIRAGWRVWARAHQKELRQMLSGDRASMLAAYDAIPVAMSATRVDRYADLDFGPMDVHSGSIQYAWYAGAEKVEALHAANRSRSGTHGAEDPRLAASIPRSISIQHQIRDFNFGIRHDFPVLGSTNGGPVMYYLWASGRITKATNSAETRENPASFHQDVVPPYDFLTR